jgi:hypothetical protein
MESGKSWTVWLRGELVVLLRSFLRPLSRLWSKEHWLIYRSTLQSLNLPGSIQALERPVGLPPSLLKKAEEVDAAGGTNRIKHLLAEAGRLSRVNANMLSEVSCEICLYDIQS